MSKRQRQLTELGLLAVLLIMLAGPFVTAARAEAAGEEVKSGYLLPFASAQRGRALFVDKGCVVCHAVNGVGGKAGPALDVDPIRPFIDPFEFAARMWRGAPTMIVLQEMELGYQIEFTGTELAQIAHFLNDEAEQQTFGEADVPARVRGWMVDDIYERGNFDEIAD